jgi:hypothetical protein
VGKGLAMSTSRRSQPPSCPAIASERRWMALFRRRCAMARQAVPLSRFTSPIGGGSTFHVIAASYSISPLRPVAR